jgi:hypothetical protein
MLNINLTSRLSTTVIGLLIFFVPFFTYLSPENLKQLSRSGVLEIFLSLIVLLVVIFIISFSVEMLLKRFSKKKIILFPLLCFAFYLNFFFTPFYEFFEEFIFLKFGFITEIGILVFIFFELCCLAVIAFGAKFNVFSIRMVLIFSILMLINAFIPLVGYLAENIGKKPTISYEINSRPLAQDAAIIKRNVYYIILDAMVAIETLEPFNIATKKEVIDKLSNTELRYIDKSQSSYNDTYFTLASMMLLDYHQKPSSPKFSYRSAFYPEIMYSMQNEIPLISYLKKANSSFIWAPGKNFDCMPSMSWTCVNLFNFSLNLWNFSLTTPLPKIINRFFKNFDSQDTIGPFLEYIDTNGVPKTPFFAYIHHNIPHSPYQVSSACEPTNYFDQDFEGYKASYQCALKTLQLFMEKINYADPEAIVIFQGDHGLRSHLNLELTEKEKYLFAGSVFNAIKAPEICFEKYGLPKTTVNTIRFSLNCAYGFKLPYRKNIHYDVEYEHKNYGIVVERKLYE